MAQDSKPATAPVTAETPPSGSSFIKRELNGATFLTLEHIGHMVVIVAVAILMAVGISTAITMWGGNSSAIDIMSTYVSGPGALMPSASMALSIAAALVVLVPILIVLDRRTRAEWLKRDGYASRLAYKVPVYTGLGVLITLKTLAFIEMLAVVFTSLAYIGVDNSGTGNMYLYQFLPATIATIIFGGSAWYFFKLAKGRDTGKMFSMMIATLGLILAIALFVTAASSAHSTPKMMPLQPNTNSPFNGGTGNGINNQDLKDLFKY